MTLKSGPDRPVAPKTTELAVTVLFSTYNGGKTLPRMLDALCRSTLHPSRWKIVAVDNNSHDDTRAILESYRDRLPLEIHFEPKQGKQYALTRGFQHLEGDLVILTDDDIIPEPDWVEQFLKLAAEHRDFSIFGGLIMPDWEKQPDPWVLKDAHLGVLYALNADIAEGAIPAALVSGPNSAFRRAIIGANYIVHEDIGPNALVTQFPMGEDTAFALRLEREGAKAYHSHRPRVRHIIKQAYVDEGWILSRGERYGMGLVATRPELFSGKFRLAGIPTGALAIWLAMATPALVLRKAPKSTGRFKALWKQSVRRGILRQFAIERARRAGSLRNGQRTGA